ncbi:MAG: DUF1887 family protein [Chromatiaceae bacterium]|jgi:hypothetical protein|nr:DUF1887 family protein [Chromatiaceae bacterium]
MKIDIALVSDQILANLIPILMDPPDRVVLVCTAEMAKRGLCQRLKRLIDQRGIAVEVKHDAPDVGVKPIQHFALELASELDARYPQAEICLNATGGTKLMSLGFVEVFRGIAGRILYTDTAHRRIELLPGAHGEVADQVPMRDVLGVKDYLAAQGFRYQRACSDDSAWQGSAAARKAVCKYLGREARNENLQAWIGTINYLADQALERVPGTYDERLTNPSQRLPNPPRGLWAKAMAEVARAGLIDWQSGAAEFAFADAQAAQFMRGGWLEEYAWHTVRDAGVNDVRMGVKGEWEGPARNTNELDVLACHHNQLLVLECKTGRFDERNDNEVAYKVDSLSQDLRGLFGETWLLSARQPTQVLLDRARQARIRIVGPSDLGRLRELVRDWIAEPAGA